MSVVVVLVISWILSLQISVWPTSAIPEVDPDVLQLNWKKVNSAPWARPEAIPALEGRALVWTVQHLARSQVNHNKPT